ncbi:hypothetical protein [Vibrio viridaestus]|uniref:Uncharacterized protein n=1 Tax=Vibrio viridaestus TaxID=2487322 RepID=A0A3N9TBB4_9VIBR|nr:hypothetical protein [Vibrio viridaestus]RQW61437.1 hypothetical protein EES38_19030 [Vibrio viridaestus]
MDADQINQVVGYVGAIVLAGISMAVVFRREKQLDDPDDDSVVYLEQLLKVTNLHTEGKYLVRILRQSGNLQKEDQIFYSPEAAIKAAIATFKRAKIEYVFITDNTETQFCFRRPYYHHGGKAEGRKVGSVEIYKVE